MFKINTIKGKTAEEWKKINSVKNKQFIEIDPKNFEEGALETGIDLGLFVTKETPSK